jgi:hypothetical protein
VRLSGTAACSSPKVPHWPVDRHQNDNRRTNLSIRSALGKSALDSQGVTAMMNRPIDAVVVSARLQRSALGERVYSEVTLRRRDGSEQRLGRVTAANRLGDVLVPGREGRFYFHDMMGSQGLHSYRPVGGSERVAFPMLVERVFGILALLNLAVVSAWLAAEAGLQLVPLMLGVLATMAWATCRGCREAVVHDLRYESRIARARSHRHAVMHSQA